MHLDNLLLILLVVGHVAREEQLLWLAVEELPQLQDVSLVKHRDCSLSIFDHQYEDLFARLIHLEESIRTNIVSFLSIHEYSHTFDTNTPRWSIPNGGHA